MDAVGKLMQDNVGSPCPGGYVNSLSATEGPPATTPIVYMYRTVAMELGPGGMKLWVSNDPLDKNIDRYYIDKLL
jgi:hypothetical protein